MLDTSAAGVPRRRFLTRLGATLAAGVGFSAFGATPAGAGGRPVVHGAPSDAQVARDSQACAIYCYKYSCPGGCASGRNLFRCYNRCDGAYHYYCYQHSCANYCLSTNIC